MVSFFASQCIILCEQYGQWRRQDLLQGGARLEIMPLCHRAFNMDFRDGCSSCSMSFVTNAVVLIERAANC